MKKYIKKWSNPKLESLNLKKTEAMYCHFFECQNSTCSSFGTRITENHLEVCPDCGNKLKLITSIYEYETGCWNCSCDDKKPDVPDVPVIPDIL